MLKSTGIERIPHHWLEEVINLSSERIVVVDREGTIVYINRKYSEFIGTTPELATGRNVQDIIENSRMHIVATTGQPEMNAVQRINGSEMIANRYPLMVDGELVGAVGTVMFSTPEEWWDYKEKIQPLLEELKFYQTKYEKEFKSKYSFDDLIGESSTFAVAKKLAERTSGSQSAVLLLGESGTGKELFAHAIHSNSTRASFPFVPINCASIPENLLESELFGYEDGAFTGAKKGGKKGQFQMAHFGTIFLDEIGDMPLAMQSKLLRVLQEKEIQRVGGGKSIPVDVRIIAATHRDLEKMVQEGTFRQDLYYRLNVIKIDIPPLRERKEDIVPIAKKLLVKLEKKFFREGTKLSDAVCARLEQHAWPGNIRELENVLERAINVVDGSLIEVADLPLYLRDDDGRLEASEWVKGTGRSNHVYPLQSLKKTLSDVEKIAIEQAIVASKGNKLEAAKLLGIGKTKLYEKCKEYGIRGESGE